MQYVLGYRKNDAIILANDANDAKKTQKHR
jgi:hypothetical protein